MTLSWLRNNPKVGDDVESFIWPRPTCLVGTSKAGKPADPAKSTTQIENGVKAIAINSAPKPKKRNIDVLAEYNREQSKPSVNFVVIGMGCNPVLIWLSVYHPTSRPRGSWQEYAVGASSYGSESRR